LKNLQEIRKKKGPILENFYSVSWFPHSMIVFLVKDSIRGLVNLHREIIRRSKREAFVKKKGMPNRALSHQNTVMTFKRRQLKKGVLD